jgi:hypothetical protein
VLDYQWSTRIPLVPRFWGSPEKGLLLLATAAIVSIVLGIRARRHGSRYPRVAAGVTVVLLGFGVLIVDRVQNAAGGYDSLVASQAYAPAAEIPTGLVYDGARVDNVYPYSREGRLLHDVLLYDGLGRPLEIRTEPALDPDRRRVVTNGNEPLDNVFPIRYYDPGTRFVARPNAAPYVELPLILTPPLPAKAER